MAGGPGVGTVSERLQARYRAALHAMQSGVNSAMCDHAALAKLLIERGVITADDYELAVVEQMEAERDRYAAELTKLLGVPVDLA
jgi:hypothetical protein